MMLNMYKVAVFWAVLMTPIVSAQDLLFELSTSVTGETYLFVGDDLNLTCVLNEQFLQNYTAHNISFKFQFRGQYNSRCVPKSNVDIVGNDMATLVIHNVSFKDVGPYGCYVGDTYCKDDKKTDLSLVGLSEDVSVEYPPHEVINFNCVVYNWISLMTCTWQHPVDYVDKSNIDVTTLYSIPQEKTPDYNCPDQSYDICKWSEEKLFPMYSYKVTIIVTNTRNNISATSTFHIEPFKLVKPDPVFNLAISAHNGSQGSFLLSWTHSMIHRDKVYRIKHSSGRDKMFNVLADNLTDTNFTTCGYPPYTFHNFSVESYPTGGNSGYWSDPEYVSGKTAMTAPSVGPRITNGSFTTSPCVSGYRTVTVMWQEVEAAAQNGIIDGHCIKLGERTLTRVAENVPSASIALPCYSNSVLTIFAHNEGGDSLVPSVLLIPSAAISVPKKIQESFSVEMISSQSSPDIKRSLRAFWEVDTEPGSVNNTIFWCRGVPGQSCTGQINWTQVAGTQTEYYIPIPSSDAEKYLYGISITDAVTELTSGIFWTGCLFSNKQSILHQTVKSLTLNIGTNEVQVSWVQIPCTYQSKIKVTNYTVKWCQSNRCNNTGEIFSYAVPAMEYMYKVSELTANVKYSFTVQPRSYEDVGDEVKPWKVAVPVAAESSSLLRNVLIIIFVVLVIILAAVILFWQCKKGKKKAKQLKSIEFFELDAVPRVGYTHTEVAASSLRNGEAVRFLPQPKIPAILSDTECDNHETNGPERTTSGQGICDGQHQYVAIQEGVSPDSASAQSYLHLGYSHSNPPYSRQIDLQGHTEKDNTEEQPTIFISDFLSQSTTDISVPGTPIAIAVTPVASPVIQDVSVSINANEISTSDTDGEIIDDPPDHSLQDLVNVYTVSDTTNSLPRMSQVNNETSSPHHNTSDFSSSGGTSSSAGNYMQINTFLEQYCAQSDNTS